MGGTTQQIAPNPGIARDDLYRPSLYATLALLNKVSGIILQPGDDIAAAVNRSKEKTLFVLQPGVYGAEGTEWVLTAACRIVALPGVQIRASIELQGPPSELFDLAFTGVASKLELSSNGNTVEGITFASTCAGSPLIEDKGVFNGIRGCSSAASPAGAVGININGNSSTAFANRFVAHATAVQYNVAGGHQLSLNLGTIVGV